MINRKDLIITLVVYKLFLTAVFIPLAYKLVPFYYDSYKQNTEFSEDRAFNASSPYKTWDSYNFLYIAKKGYENGRSKFNVLFPLYPILIKVLTPLFRGNAVACGILLSNIFSLVAILYFFYFARRYFNETIAVAGFIFLLAFPASFYFSLIYSEPLFFMLIMMFFYYAYSKRYLLAAISAFFLPLTRLVGISAIILFAVIYFENLRKDKDDAQLLKKIRPDALYLLFPAAGFAVLLIFFYLATGNAFEWLDSQRMYIAGHSVANTLNPLKTLYSNFFKTSFTLHGYTDSLIDRAAFILFTSALFFIFRQQRFSLFLYSFFAGFLPGVSSNLMSYLRYICVAFPIFYFLGINFNFEKKKLSFCLLLIIFALMQGLFLARHVNYFWVG